MTECPFISPIPDRFLRQHRSNHLVRSAPIRRTNGAKRHLSGSNPGACLWRNLQSVGFKPHTNAPAAFTNTTNGTLSP